MLGHADEKLNGGLSENPIAALEAAQAMEVDEKPEAGAGQEEKMDTDTKEGLAAAPEVETPKADPEVGETEPKAAETPKAEEMKVEESKPEPPKKKKVVNEDLLRAFRYFDKTGSFSAWLTRGCYLL